MKKDAIAKFSSESDLKKFLDNAVKFNKYSFNNLVLIYSQKEDAKYIASFKTFSKMGYQINKGAKGIKIFIPNFYNVVKIEVDDNKYVTKPLFSLTEEELQRYKDKNDGSVTLYGQKLSGFSLGNVFDASDTNMPLDVIEQELNPVLVDKKADEIMDCVIKTIYKDGFKVRFDHDLTEEKGHCNLKDKEIVVKQGLDNLMQLKILLHEYGHSLAHRHLEQNYKEYQDYRNKYETEAESIAYVVAKYLGLDTSAYSLGYLYSWSKEKDFKEVDDSLSTIINYSKRIINNFENFFDREFGQEEDFSPISV